VDQVDKGVWLGLPVWWHCQLPRYELGINRFQGM